jgi:hypothetical protein
MKKYDVVIGILIVVVPVCAALYAPEMCRGMDPESGCIEPKGAAILLLAGYAVYWGGKAWRRWRDSAKTPWRW